MKEQERIIEKIKNLVETKVAKYGRKIVEYFEVEELGAGNIKVVRFQTNLKNGNCFTETSGQLFIGPRGGVTGRIRTFGNETRLESRGQLYKVDMWI